MKRYRIVPGVVLVSVCGEHMLVATREARKTVPYINQINDAGAAYWSLLSRNTAPGQMVRYAAERYGYTGEQAAAAVGSFLKKLYQRGYLVVEETEEKA